MSLVIGQSNYFGFGFKTRHGRHGIGIRHTLILYDKGIPKLGEYIYTATASTATIYLLAKFISCKSNYHCVLIKLIYENSSGNLIALSKENHFSPLILDSMLHHVISILIGL